MKEFYLEKIPSLHCLKRQEETKGQSERSADEGRAAMGCSGVGGIAQTFCKIFIQEILRKRELVRPKILIREI